MDGIKSWIVEKAWRKIRRTSRILWLLTLYGADVLIDAVGEYIEVIRREFELFSGITLFAIGLFGFNAARFCDGNTADHLSCTRPTAYYYFSWVDITLIVLGIFFLMFWYLARQQGRKN